MKCSAEGTDMSDKSKDRLRDPALWVATLDPATCPSTLLTYLCIQSTHLFLGWNCVSQPPEGARMRDSPNSGQEVNSCLVCTFLSCEKRVSKHSRVLPSFASNTLSKWSKDSHFLSLPLEEESPITLNQYQFISGFAFNHANRVNPNQRCNEGRHREQQKWSSDNDNYWDDDILCHCRTVEMLFPR